MIDPRFQVLEDRCDSVYLTAHGDGYTPVNMLHSTASLGLIPKDGRRSSFEVTGTDLDDMIAEAVRRTESWAVQESRDRDGLRADDTGDEL